jgi:hypothetical protein
MNSLEMARSFFAPARLDQRNQGPFAEKIPDEKSILRTFCAMNCEPPPPGVGVHSSLEQVEWGRGIAQDWARVFAAQRRLTPCSTKAVICSLANTWQTSSRLKAAYLSQYAAIVRHSQPGCAVLLDMLLCRNARPAQSKFFKVVTRR